MNLNCLPSKLLLSCAPPSDIIVEIQADFGLPTSVHDPFADIVEELTGTLLFDPFNLSVDEALGLSVEDSEGKQLGPTFDGWHKTLRKDPDNHASVPSPLKK